MPDVFWSKLGSAVIKRNTDAALTIKGSFLAVVARNDRGDLLNIHSFKSLISIPEVTKLERVLKVM